MASRTRHPRWGLDGKPLKNRAGVPPRAGPRVTWPTGVADQDEALEGPTSLGGYANKRIPRLAAASGTRFQDFTERC